jgi:hypothetical protein
MPGKSRRRHVSRSKKGKGRLGSSAISVQPQAVAQTYEPVVSSGVAAPSARASTPTPTLTPIRYPYIVTELRTIGIVAGIMLVILVVLALIFS